MLLDFHPPLFIKSAARRSPNTNPTSKRLSIPSTIRAFLLQGSGVIANLCLAFEAKSQVFAFPPRIKGRAVGRLILRYALYLISCQIIPIWNNSHSSGVNISRIESTDNSGNSLKAAFCLKRCLNAF
ncbi:hypothetical protein CEXT_726041 [Caerostris extrusa]|uniref:Uncharacterized protein n=1 Tax=Caerostris extrusa TaxID=172846 RepID=A0AAV4NSK9_CAEEX|nr:hypothetical protein CEXT_726041 [Caerostris extrusa]